MTQIVETKSINLRAPILIEGFPDVGLVGGIAASHIVVDLELSEVAYMFSKRLPPVTVLHKGLPFDPIRVHAGNNLLVIVSETQIPPNLVYEMVDAVVNWAKEKKVKLFVSLGGLPTAKRRDLDTLKVFGVGTTGEVVKSLEDNGIEIIREGVMIGIDGVLFKECHRSGIPAMMLFAQSYYDRPDPMAAATVLEALNKVLGLSVSTKSLVEEVEEIERRTRQLMSRTNATLRVYQKPEEGEAPLMYIT